MSVPPTPPSSPLPPDPARAASDRARFRRTLVRVMTVQVVTVLLLWLVQRHFTP